MDSFLKEEEVDLGASRWNFTSKALMFSIFVVGLSIVISVATILIGVGDVANSVEGNNVGRVSGEFNTQKPSGSGGSGNILNPGTGQQSGNSNEVEDDVIGDDVIGDDQDVGDDNLVFDELEDSGLDPAIMDTVIGCLKREIKGDPCDNTFVREDIIDYCDELEEGYDTCYVMTALMNSKEDNCEFVEDPGLSERCFEAFEG